MADYTACRREYDRRSSIINRVHGKARASATQRLRRDMVAMAAGASFTSPRVSADGHTVAL
jgi:hypothetical protein